MSDRPEARDGDSAFLAQILTLNIPGLQEEKLSPIVEALQARDLTEMWQIEGLDSKVIDDWFPQGTALLANLTIKKIQKASATHTHSESGNSTNGPIVAALKAQEHTMKPMTDRIKKDKKEKKSKRARSRSSGSV